MLNVYRPVPNDLFAPAQSVIRPRALRLLIDWYDAIAGAVTALLAALLVLPLLARAPWMALWPLAFVSYQITLVSLARRPESRRAILGWASGLLRSASLLIYGPPEPQPAHEREPGSATLAARRARDRQALALLNGALSFALAAAAFVFILTLDRAGASAGVLEPLLSVSWLLYFLPVLRAARYASLPWVLALAALVILGDMAAWALGVGRVDGMGLWVIAMHACWLTLISLLPAISLRYLSERRADLARALDVVREMSRLTTTGDPSETAFANQAAAIIAGRLGYDEVNILLATSDNQRIARGLRFYGASSANGRRLVESGYAVLEEKGITGWCANHGETRLVNDVLRDRDGLYLRHEAFPHTRAEIALPLKLGGEAAGVLDVQSARAFAFTEDDEDLLNAVAEQLALALDNMRRLTRAQGLTEVTRGIARRLLAQQELRPALDEVVRIARETLDADSVVFYPRDPESRLIGEPNWAGGFVTAPSSADQVIQKGDHSAVARALRANSPLFEAYDPQGGLASSGFVAREGVRAAAILPLRVSPFPGGSERPGGADAQPTEALGVIFVNYLAPRLFPPEYRAWLAALGDLAALALQSAMLYQRVAEEERANTWHDIHDGMAAQVSMGRMLLEQTIGEWRRSGTLSAPGGEKLLLAGEVVHALQRQVNYLIDVWRERDTSDIWARSDGWTREEPQTFFGELDDFTSLVRRTLEITCVSSHDGDDAGLSRTLRHDALMIVRESVNNAYRHGRAQRIEVAARIADGALRITVRDDGCGLDPSMIRNSHGIIGMKDRVARHGGSFTPMSSREEGVSGTTITAVLLLAAAQDPASSAPRSVAPRGADVLSASREADLPNNQRALGWTPAQAAETVSDQP